MGIYDDFSNEVQSAGRLAKLEKVEAPIISVIQNRFPQVPSDYLLFLQEIGSGEIGQGDYVIYNGLLEPDEIFDDITADNFTHILIFGDDMQGYTSGFDTQQDWSIVEIDSSDMSYEKTFNSFSDFIRNKVYNL